MFPVDTRFLIVDDSPALRNLERGQLSRLGYKDVVEADDGQMALELATEHQSKGRPFGIILLDWNMPVMTGIDFLAKIKADPVLKAIPVLLVTAESDLKQVIQAISTGASDYLVKPFDEYQLKAKLFSVWDRTDKMKRASKV